VDDARLVDAGGSLAAPDGPGVDTGRVPTSTPAPDAASGPDVSTLTYEQARDDLVAVVARLEAGGATLEESLALWERGEALAARCQEWLDNARDRLAAAQARDADARVDA
jgi:exodeoxyribonuclease VII small subunit